jgi:hypothetical protein
MLRRRWGSARITTTGIGLIVFVVGLLMVIDPSGDFRSEDQSPVTGIVIAAVGVAILVGSAWLARHRPDDTPWNPLMDGDLHGGL